ncbi:MAG: WG repeat-containing protein [Prevotella sp.]|nr:WG repeat-containing protein [Prevotella sp.]
MRKTVMMFALAALACLSVHAQSLEPMYNEKGLFGYGDKGSKTFTIKPQWDEARPFNEYGVAIVRKGQMYGLIDKNGKAIGKALGYSAIAPYDGTDYWIVALGGKYTETTPANRKGLCAYGFKGSLSYGVSGAKWGILRRDGTAVVEPKYQELSDLMDGKMIAFQEKSLLGLLDKSGKVLFEAKYNVVTPFNNQGLAALRTQKGSKWSLINREGKVVIPEEAGCNEFFSFREKGGLNMLRADSLLAHKEWWDDAERLMPMVTTSRSWLNSERPYIVSTVLSNKTWLFLLYDLDGNQLIGPGAELTDMLAPSEGIALVAKGTGKNKILGLYNLGSQEFIPLDNSRGYYSVKEGHSLTYDPKTKSDYYLVDEKGEKVSDSYDEVTDVDHLLIVRKGEKYGLITRAGKEIVPVECLSVIDADNGSLFGVRTKEEKFGYVDEKGDTIIPFDYALGSKFDDNYAMVVKKLEDSTIKAGMIDKENNTIVPFKYNSICFDVDNNGKLHEWVVEKDGNFSKIDMSSHNGTSDPKLIETEYANMMNVRNGIAVKNAQGLFGLIKNGEEVIPCSVASKELVDKVYDFMASHDMTEVSAVNAHKIAVWTNDKRNTYKLGDTIDNDIWDF